MVFISKTSINASLEINANSVVPLNSQLVQMLRRQVEAGALPPDQRIPSEREIGESFGVSRDTVRRAIAQLVRSGHLMKIPRRGTFASTAWSAAHKTAVLRHRLWPNEEDREIYGRAFDRFEQAWPETAVERSEMPEQFDVVKLWGTSGKLYADRVLPLADWIADSPMVRRMPDAALNGFGGRDGLLGIPILYSGAMLLYNRERFNEASLAHPDSSWDWDALLAIARKLDDPQRDRFGFYPHDHLSALLPLIWQNGGDLMDAQTGLCSVGSQRVVEAMEYFQQLTSAPCERDVRPTSLESEMILGRFAMCFWGGRLGAGARRMGKPDAIGVAPPPRGRTRATSFFGEAIGVQAGTAHPEQALALAEELASRQTIRELAAGRNYLVTDPALQARSKAARVYLDAIEYTRTALGPMDLEVYRMLSVGFAEIAGSAPAAEVCGRIEQNVNALLRARQAQLQDASW